MAAGLLLAPLTTEPWHLYATLGVLVGGGSVCLGYSGQSLFLPNWFVRRRGLATGIAFAGVGVGSIVLLPAVQLVIESAGWRTACWTMGLLVLVVLAPINLLLRKRPEDMGLQPDGDAAPGADCDGATVERRRPGLGGGRLDARARHADGPLLVDRARLFLRALRLVRRAGAPDQVPDRDRLQPDRRGVGARASSAWSAFPARSRWATSPTASAASGYGPPARSVSPPATWLLLLLQAFPSTRSALSDGRRAGRARLWPDLRVLAAIVAEIFQGKHYGTIFGTLMLARDRRRRGGALGHRRAVRRLRQLYARLLDRRGRQRGVGAGNLAGGTAQSARGGRPGCIACPTA